MTAQRPPETTTTSNLGLALVIGGQVVGATFEWAPRQQRTVTPVYEFGMVTTGANAGQVTGPGEAYELVPGNITGTTISIRRYDLYSEPFEVAFGTKLGMSTLDMLSKQSKAIEAREFQLKPDNSQTSNIYKGCWFGDKGRQHSATGDRVVMVNATLHYARVIPA